MAFGYTLNRFHETYDEAYYWGVKSKQEFYIHTHYDDRRNRYEIIYT